MRDIARRSLLAGILAIPAATVAAALPLPVLAYPAAPMAHVDADLIAMADRVARLARLYERAFSRSTRKGDAVNKARGAKPVEPANLSGATEIEEHAVDPTSDVERRFTMTFCKSPVDHQEARQAHADALAAWSAEGERLARLNGAAGAGALCDKLFDHLQDTTDLLAGTPAIGAAGMTAKAGAFLALMQTRHGAEEWEVDLGRSLARDAARIGSGAA